MNQETADNKTEKSSRKSTWLLSLAMLFPLAVAVGAAVRHSSPQNTMPVEGEVVILDENGEAVPFQPTRIDCFSLYAPHFFRYANREQYLHVSESGRFRCKIPEFAATLFFDTEDGKYAAIVDVTPDKPPTGLVVELRPRYSITGRLVHETTGTPFANQEVRLECSRCSDFGVDDPFWWGNHAYGKTILTMTTTDAEGFFAMDKNIPGVKYDFRIGGCTKSMEMPILQPEQYQQPFSVGDVFVQ